jgi:hypothetical protein
VIAWLRGRNRKVAERTSPFAGIALGLANGLLAVVCAVEAIIMDRPWYVLAVVGFALVGAGWFRRGLKARTRLRAHVG